MASVSARLVVQTELDGAPAVAEHAEEALRERGGLGVRIQVR